MPITQPGSPRSQPQTIQADRFKNRVTSFKPESQWTRPPTATLPGTSSWKSHNTFAVRAEPPPPLYKLSNARWTDTAAYYTNGTAASLIASNAARTAAGRQSDEEDGLFHCSTKVRLPTWRVYYYIFCWTESTGQRVLLRDHVIHVWERLIHRVEHVASPAEQLAVEMRTSYWQARTATHAYLEAKRISELLEDATSARYQLPLEMGEQLENLARLEESGIVPLQWLPSPSLPDRLSWDSINPIMVTARYEDQPARYSLPPESRPPAALICKKVTTNVSDWVFRVAKFLLDNEPPPEPDVETLVSEAREVFAFMIREREHSEYTDEYIGSTPWRWLGSFMWGKAAVVPFLSSYVNVSPETSSGGSRMGEGTGGEEGTSVESPVLSPPPSDDWWVQTYLRDYKQASNDHSTRNHHVRHDDAGTRSEA